MFLFLLDLKSLTEMSSAVTTMRFRKRCPHRMNNITGKILVLFDSHSSFHICISLISLPIVSACFVYRHLYSSLYILVTNYEESFRTKKTAQLLVILFIHVLWEKTSFCAQLV